MSPPNFSPTCPNNSKFYACPKSSVSAFIGCCSIDPCGLSTGCTISNLHPVSFNASSYGTTEFPPDPDCGAADIKPYSCVSGDKKNTFWGCCKSVPCAVTPPVCKEGDFAQAVLKTDMQFKAWEDSGKGKEGGKGGVSTGVIVGATVGGAVVIAAIVVVLVFFLCKKRRGGGRKGEKGEVAGVDGYGNARTPMGLGLGDSKTEGYRASVLSEAPSTYRYSHMPSPNASHDPSSPQPHHSPFSLSPNTTYQGYQQVPMELHAVSSPPTTPGQVYAAELPADGQAKRQSQFRSPVEMESPAPSPRLVQGEMGKRK